MTLPITITFWAYIGLSALAILLYIPKLIQFRYAFQKPTYRKAKTCRRISVVIPARTA